MVAGDVLVGCVGANSAGSGRPHFLPGHRAEIHRQLTGANIMMLAGETHWFILFIYFFGNLMNDINYSTVESWRNSLGLIEKTHCGGGGGGSGAFSDQHGARRQQGALHPSTCLSDGWGKLQYGASTSIALQRQHKDGAAGARCAADTRDNHANIAHI